MSINSLLRWFLTLLIIVIACVFCYIRYNAYFRNPWTRDGMVQAEVVQVAARVSGEVKTVHVRDNQFVKVGDPLFDLDDRPSRVALSQAEANVRQKQAVAKAARQGGARCTASAERAGCDFSRSLSAGRGSAPVCRS